MAQQGVHGVWTSRWTFILAATGSAVGLGNIWKFPYITGENGGGAFVFVYLACIALIGIPVMMAEVLIGRRGRQSPVNAVRLLAGEAGVSRNWACIGWLGMLAGLFIMSFYSVVAGWALNYAFSAGSGVFDGSSSETASGYFQTLLASPWRLLAWHSLFTLMTAGVVALGVTRGLGAVAKYMMPFLFFTLLMLVGYSFTNGRFAEGVDFLFSFNLAKLTWASVLTALGHAFFTLSLGMGAIMAYGAYMPKEASIGRTVMTIGLLDTMVALVAGLAIFPIVFANPALEPGSGPSLLFISLPVAFGGMPLGTLFGTLFFILITVAAWSSAVSLIEPSVAWLVETRRFNRFSATALLSGVAWLLGIACLLSFNTLADFKPFYLFYKTPFDFFDFLTSQIMLPAGGLSIALFVGWLMQKKAVKDELRTSQPFIFEAWRFVVRYISPALIALVMVAALINSFKG